MHTQIPLHRRALDALFTKHVPAASDACQLCALYIAGTNSLHHSANNLSTDWKIETRPSFGSSHMEPRTALKCRIQGRLLSSLVASALFPTYSAVGKAWPAFCVHPEYTGLAIHLSHSAMSRGVIL